MKILYILNELAMGGAQTYTIELMNEMHKMKHEVYLMILSNNLQLVDRLNPEIPRKISARSKKIDFKVLQDIRTEIASKPWDAVISSYPQYVNYATRFMRRLPPVLYPLHSTKERNYKGYLYVLMSFFLKKKNEHFISSIDSQTEYLEKAYFRSKGYFKQVYNGVNTERFSEVPGNFDRKAFLKSKGINPENKVILMVAGFRPEKRHVDAIQAFIKLKSKSPKTSLVFLGDERVPQYHAMKEQVKNSGAEDLHVFLASEGGDVRNFYWASNVFTLTSNKVETFPITALESMACGLPCVLSDVGGTRDFIRDGFNGYLVKPEDTDSICNGWLTVLEGTGFDKQAIRQFIVANYSIISSTNAYLKLIEEFNRKE